MSCDHDCVTMTASAKLNLHSCSDLPVVSILKLYIEYYDSVCFLYVVFTSRWVGKFDISRDQRSSEMSKFSNASRSKYSQQETHPGIIFHLLYT